MKRYEKASEFTTETKISSDTLEKTFGDYLLYATGKLVDPTGKSNYIHLCHSDIVTDLFPIETFEHAVYKMDEPLLVAELTPVVHYVRD